jgi:hypothetical protein
MPWSTIVPIAISVASAGFAYWTFRQTRRGATYADATDRTLAIDRLFVDHPEARPYFYDDKPVEGGTDRDLVLAIAEFVMDSFECLWDMAKRYEADDRAAWSVYFADMFRRSPALRDFYAEYADWYPSMTDWLAGQDARP